MDERDKRIEDLEVRHAFQEQAIADLDQVVRELGDALERVRRELSELRETVQHSSGPATKPEDEIPPHY